MCIEPATPWTKTQWNPGVNSEKIAVLPGKFRLSERMGRILPYPQKRNHQPTSWKEHHLGKLTNLSTITPNDTYPNFVCVPPRGRRLSKRSQGTISELNPHRLFNHTMSTTPKLLLAVVASSMLVFGCSTPRHAGHCEYKTVILSNRPEADAKLNELGAEGWVVVGFSRNEGGSNTSTFVLMRRK
jgi:hypothetical protein